MIVAFAHVHRRRRALAQVFSVSAEFERLEESCIPSYCHPNVAAAWVAWWRLFTAVSIAQRTGIRQPVLDFGSGSGELAHLLDEEHPYRFVEIDDGVAIKMEQLVPRAMRCTLEDVSPSSIGTIFALDVLEHVDDPDVALTDLGRLLVDDGILVISGPTENWLYRLGRRISGFSGHYHHRTIYEIEALANRHFKKLACRRGPWPLPLFSISVWRKP